MNSVRQFGPLTAAGYSDAIDHFAAGVAIVSATGEGGPIRTLASSIASVSIEPPMLLICLKRDSRVGQAIERSGHFVVDVLAEDQRDLAGHFENSESSARADLEWLDEQLSLGSMLVHLDCDLTERVTSASHSIFIGVVSNGAGFGGRPLVKYRGRYGVFADS
jgi:flavin reductase (DIM6/NTAB) family NADH-FMN oxidoreductase RutF